MNSVSRAIPFGLLGRSFPKRFILYGHLVHGRDHFVSDYYRYPSVEEFDKLLSSLQQLGYVFVDLKDYLKEDGRKKILLTFDDGFKAIHDNLYPYMLAKNFPYVIFVLTDPLSDPFFYIKSIKPIGPRENSLFLSVDEIQDLKDKGVHIGFHTRGHRKIESNDINDPEALQQLEIPRQYLDLFSQPLCFAYPYLAPANYAVYNEKMKRESGFEYFFDTQGFRSGGADHFFRVSIDAEKGIWGKDWIRFVIKRQWVRRLYKGILGK